jgi:hypothetical protein
VGTIAWASTVSLLLAWEAFSHVARKPGYPTFARVARAFLGTTAGRVAMFGLWVWIGFHFFVKLR